MRKYGNLNKRVWSSAVNLNLTIIIYCAKVNELMLQGNLKNMDKSVKYQLCTYCVQSLNFVSMYLCHCHRVDVWYKCVLGVFIITYVLEEQV